MRYTYVSLELFDQMNDAIRVVRKIGLDAVEHLLRIRHLIQGFRFYMEESQPFFEVNINGQWVDFITLEVGKNYD